MILGVVATFNLGDLWYVTTNFNKAGGNKGDVLIVDVSDPNDPAIIEAVYGDKTDGVRGYGCGLLNTPDSKHMITNVGNKSQDDVEGVLKWKYANNYDWTKTGPVDEATMPQNDDNGDGLPDNSNDVETGVAAGNYAIRAGDATTAQSRRPGQRLHVAGAARGRQHPGLPDLRQAEEGQRFQRRVERPAESGD